ncbi:hypothetical protein FOA52_007376 [Chlamydomonas sp. UWO 241]|nr:hypothetical protein FOA52_007376 [Chlamydomonas sp. UWO 241]
MKQPWPCQRDHPRGASPVSRGGRPRLNGNGTRYVGISWDQSRSSWYLRLGRDSETKKQGRTLRYAVEEDAARAYDFAAVQAHGPGTKRNFPNEVVSELPATAGQERKQRSSSLFVGVSWHKTSSSWNAWISNPQTKRNRHIGSYTSEEDAARAYDCAAVQACGSGTKRNFPGELVSDWLPATLGEKWKQRSSSSYFGVSWSSSKSAWQAHLSGLQTKQRHIGRFASEEDAARAYDYAAVQAHGPGAKRNFPGEVVGEAPATLGEKRKQRKSSRYMGVSWASAGTSWCVRLLDPQTKRRRTVGSFACEEDAARAYDCAVVQAHGPGAKRNFPNEIVSEPPANRLRRWNN